MASPRADSYSAASGGAIYAGRAAPSAAPAWMATATVGQWKALPNSTGVGGASIDPYSGFVVDDNLNVWIFGAGGHTDSSDNRVVKYAAGADAPTGWSLVCAPSSSVQPDVAYFADGRPNSAHTYEYIFFDKDTQKLYRFGAFGLYVQAKAANTIDSFPVNGTDWDPAGTNPYTSGTTLTLLSAANAGAVQDPSTGTIWWIDQLNSNNIMQWKPGTSKVNKGAGAIGIDRMPNVFDTSRNAIFNLQWGDGWGANTGIRSTLTTNPYASTPTKQTISYNASAALTAFQAATPNHAAMAYDELRDKYVFACGNSGPPQLFEITPNAGSTWDMATVTPTGTVANLANAGATGKLRYVRRGSVGGFLFIPSAAGGLYFLRTA